MPTTPDIVRDTNFYVLPPGRRVFAFEQVAAEAGARGLADLAARADAAAQHDRLLLDQQARYRGAGAPLHGSEARELDGAVDRSTTSVDSVLSAQMTLFGPDHPRGRAAGELRAALFPQGVRAITRQPYVQQHVEIENLLARAAAPELAEGRAALPELEPMLAQLAEINRAYGDTLAKEQDQPSGDELRELDAQGQRRLVELVVLIYAHFLREAPADQDGLAALLEPVYLQNEAVRLARRRRRNALRDIDPDTGDEQPEPPVDDEPVPDDGELGDDEPVPDDGELDDDEPAVESPAA